VIVGLGLDVCEIARVRRSLTRHGDRFMARLLTPAEAAYCARHADPATPFAGRFAAKEALIKALGAPEGLRWHDMEVVRDARGRPSLALRGAAAEAAASLGAVRSHLSLTHDAGVAAAVVVLELGP
jgi:holo-[acyl-carrier protein] synthase